MMDYYPVSLNIRNKRCVVCGGGEVACRKVRVLLECGADVEVISPASCRELEDIAGEGKVQVHRREYREGDLRGAFVVIAATDDKDVNRKIAGEAHKAGCIVNAVDDAESSDFIVPSCLKRGDITIAVSTSGKSPALARKLRTGLESRFGEEYACLLEIVSQVRREVKLRGLKISESAWQKSLDLGLLTGLIKEGKEAEAKSMLIQNLVGEMD